MNVVMIGAGYVGLVSGACFAEFGANVTCLDVDEGKVDALQNGKIPIYEPGLAELVRRNAAADRLHFTTDVAEAIVPAELVYLAVGTPQDEDGSADLSALMQVVRDISPHLAKGAIVVAPAISHTGPGNAICGGHSCCLHPCHHRRRCFLLVSVALPGLHCIFIFYRCFGFLFLLKLSVDI